MSSVDVPPSGLEAAEPPRRSRSWWADRGVRTKTLAAVVVTAVVALVVGVLGLFALNSSADATRQMHDSNIVGLEAVAEMQSAIAGVRQASRDALLAPTHELTVDEEAHLAEQLAAYHEAVEAYRSTNPSAEKWTLIEGAQADFDEYERLVEEVLSPLAEAKDYAGWYTASSTQTKPLADRAQAELTEIHELEVAEADAAAEHALEQFESQRTLAITVLGVGIALALGIGLMVARGIARNVARVQEVAESLAVGDLTRTSGLASRDELGRMGAALDTAVESMREVLGSMAASADAVAASSEELSASSAQISASAEETSAQSGVVSGAAEEVSRSVATVAAGAEQM